MHDDWRTLISETEPSQGEKSGVTRRIGIPFVLGTYVSCRSISPREPPEPQLIRHPRPDHMFWSTGGIEVGWRSQIFVTSRARNDFTLWVSPDSCALLETTL